MKDMPTPYQDPPPEPRTVKCERCGADTRSHDLYFLRGGNLCLDCASEVAINTISGTPRTISDEELDTAFLVVSLWLASRKGDLMSVAARQLRAAYRAQPRRTT